MKIIDLLNKIENDEEVPKYVQYYNMLKDKIDIMMVCKENIFYKLDQLEIQLNSRIEPVEEEKKIPEKITMRAGMVGSIDNKLENLNINTMAVEDKINEIIDYLKSKGE